MAIFAAIISCVANLATVEIILSAVIYAVLVNYVIQHFSTEKYLKPKSSTDKVYNSWIGLFSIVWDYFYVSIAVIIIGALIVVVIREWRNVTECYQKAKRGLLLVCKLMKETEQQRTALLVENAIIDQIAESQRKLARESSSLQKMVSEQSDKLADADCNYKKPFSIFSARQLLQGTPRQSISSKQASELFQRRLRDLDLSSQLKSPRDALFDAVSDDRLKLLRLHGQCEQVMTRDLDCNVKPFCESRRTGTCNLNQIDSAYISQSPEKPGVVKQNASIGNFGTLWSRKLANENTDHDCASVDENSRRETTSPFSRPLVMAETTSLLASHRYTPPQHNTCQSEGEHRGHLNSNILTKSASEMQSTYEVNVGPQNSNETGVSPQNSEPSHKVSELIRRRNETRRQIDLCLNQLDESVISQCDSIATQQSFITSPKYHTQHQSSLHKRPSAAADSSRAVREVFHEIESEFAEQELEPESESEFKEVENERFENHHVDETNTYLEPKSALDKKQAGPSLDVLKLIPPNPPQIPSNASSVDEGYNQESPNDANVFKSFESNNDFENEDDDEDDYEASFETGVSDYHDPKITYRLSNEKQHTYRTESSGSIKGDTYRSRANSKVSKEILHQSLELQPEVFPSPRGSSAAPSNCPSAETNEDIEDKLLEGDDSDNVDNIQQGTCRISTPFYTNGSFTSSTDLDKFGFASAHGDDVFNQHYKPNMGAKKSDNCNSSSSGDHLSPAITHENLSIASKSQIFESNDRLNILSAVGRNMHIFTSTVETESDFFKSDPTFDSGELAHNELDTMREYIRNRGVPTWDRTDACNKALKPSRMESLSWSTEPDATAPLFVREVPKTETCLIDKSLCLQSEFATLSFQGNSIDGQTPRDLNISQCVQKIYKDSRYLNTKIDRCHPVDMSVILHKCREEEHESILSFELLSFLSDIYIEKPIVRKGPRLNSRSSTLTTPPQYSSAENRNLSSPTDSIQKQSRLPVPVNRYPSSNSNWSAKGSPRLTATMGPTVSTRDSNALHSEQASSSRSVTRKNSRNSFKKVSLSTEMEPFLYESDREPHHKQNQPEMDQFRPDVEESETSDSRKSSKKGSKKSQKNESEGKRKDGKNLNLSSALKEYSRSRQNVFNRLYK
ncbi:uncharacterized protein LOC142342118 isoform X2 [Convolutriloba macropyga]|uniref:uncharacterized protein LOC142342118 isoform X2 n=1 Tax=Convolutriloba macropyga TaxID=536237 RepID=UPI003F51C39F